eukprot:1138553-Pelagomonas_calceolata.AAC.4
MHHPSTALGGWPGRLSEAAAADVSEGAWQERRRQGQGACAARCRSAAERCCSAARQQTGSRHPACLAGGLCFGLVVLHLFCLLLPCWPCAAAWVARQKPLCPVSGKAGHTWWWCLLLCEVWQTEAAAS